MALEMLAALESSVAPLGGARVDLHGLPARGLELPLELTGTIRAAAADDGAVLGIHAGEREAVLAELVFGAIGEERSGPCLGVRVRE